LESQIIAFLGREPLATPEIVAVRDASTLRPVHTLEEQVVVLLFVRIGTTRLLDNRIMGRRVTKKVGSSR
jgi:pantoate--beta-alanine ligase